MNVFVNATEFIERNNNNAAPPSASPQPLPQSQQTSFKMEQPPPENMIIVGILIGLIVFLCMVLGWVALPPILAWVRRKMPVSQKRINRRYATIDGWLISKRVQPHDKCCELLIKQLTDDPSKYNPIPVPLVCQPCCQPANNSTSPAESIEDDTGKKRDPPSAVKCDCSKEQGWVKTKTGKLTFSPTSMLHKLASIHWDKEDMKQLNGKNGNFLEPQKTKALDDSDRSSEAHIDEEEESMADSFNKSCGICLEKFRVGEAVSWSSDPRCGHVFHHECLRDWLLRRTGCPYCRTIFLPVDIPKKKKLLQREKFSQDQLHYMAGDRARYLTRTFFCIEEGLVVLRGLENPYPPAKKKVEEAPKKEDSPSNTAPTRRRLQFWKRSQEQESQNTELNSDCEKSSIDRSVTCRTARLNSKSETFMSEDDFESGDSSYNSSDEGDENVKEYDANFTRSNRTDCSDSAYSNSARTDLEQSVRTDFEQSIRTNLQETVEEEQSVVTTDLEESVATYDPSVRTDITDVEDKEELAVLENV